MKNKIFEFMLIHTPKDKDKKEMIVEINEEIKGLEFYTEVFRLIAKDEREALIKASRMIPEEYADKLDEVEIIIRPF